MSIAISIVGCRKGCGIGVAPPLAVAPISSAGRPAEYQLDAPLFAVARDRLQPMLFSSR
ncbi:MAG: hypothetical protein WCL59_11450 [Cyanobium sp. ELA507]|jgi:hypothetical protein